MTSQKRGPSEDRGVMMDRILTVARQSFATHGSAGTSMRAVAIEAGVDPRLITYYFGDKQSLLEACLVPPAGYLERVNAVVHGPMRGRGKAMVANMLHFWENPDTVPVLRAMILTAVHEPVALQLLQAIFRDNMVAAVADALGDDQRDLRANLAAAQIIGLCMTRYVYQLDPIASMAAESVIELVGPSVQRSLSGPLPTIIGESAVHRPARQSGKRAAKTAAGKISPRRRLTTSRRTGTES